MLLLHPIISTSLICRPPSSSFFCLNKMVDKRPLTSMYNYKNSSKRRKSTGQTLLLLCSFPMKRLKRMLVQEKKMFCYKQEKHVLSVILVRGR